MGGQMNKRIIVCYLLLCICLHHCFVAEEAKHHMIDESLIDVLSIIKAEFYLSEATSVHAVEYVNPEDYGLSIEKVIETDHFRVELYRGKKGGLLALAVRDDRIYCAQYINEIASDSVVNMDEVYTHTLISAGSGMYSEVHIAFFADGKSLEWFYTNPNRKNVRLSIYEKESIFSIDGIQHYMVSGD